MNVIVGKIPVLITFVIFTHGTHATAWENNLSVATWEHEFSIFLEAGRSQWNDKVLDQLFYNMGYERINGTEVVGGIGLRWKCSKTLGAYLHHSAFWHDGWGTAVDEMGNYTNVVEMFATSTLMDIEFEFEKFPLNLIRPCLGVGFGSLQLQSPPVPPIDAGRPFNYKNYPGIDSLLENPGFESKLSRRYGLFHMSLGPNIMGLRASEKKGDDYQHYLALGIRVGYVFSLISSDWSLGSLKVNNGPEVGMSYFYFKVQVGYGGRW